VGREGNPYFIRADPFRPRVWFPPEGSEVTLSEVPVRTPVTVTALTMPDDQRRRLTELGLRHGVRVEVLRRAPFGGPVTLRVGTDLLALRRLQATQVLVGTEVS
jgi:ferrous iron transport protein A